MGRSSLYTDGDCSYGQSVSVSHLLLLLLSRFSLVRPVRPHRWQPTRLPCPWDSPGKNTGVGCHFLLQCVKVKSESEVAQLCPTLCDPVDCSPPGSLVHGTLRARVLAWGAIAFSEGTPRYSIKSRKFPSSFSLFRVSNHRWVLNFDKSFSAFIKCKIFSPLF